MCKIIIFGFLWKKHDPANPVVVVVVVVVVGLVNRFFFPEASSQIQQPNADSTALSHLGVRFTPRTFNFVIDFCLEKMFL